ncbi:MAG: SDR family oxidoreductase [Geminicoccaceae bacterium]
MGSGRLAGKRALITAGAGGIGLEMARLFSAEGADIWICDVDEGALAAADAGFRKNRCDVSNEADVEAMFASIEAEWGALDILVNNAGIAGPTAPVEDISTEDRRRTIDVDLNGSFYCTRKAVPLLKKSAGSIVNMSSVAGRIGYPLRTPYAAAKWAIVGFTKSLAGELGPDGVRVNTILPGPVAGPRIQSVFDARATQLGVTPADVEAQYVEKVALRKLVTARDIAEMALFLCSDAGASISGQALSVCGGMEAL